MNEKMEALASEHTNYGENRAKELIQESVRLREENYLSQQDVVTILGGNSHAGLSRMERGRLVPGLDRFLKILSVYGYTLKITKKDPKA